MTRRQKRNSDRSVEEIHCTIQDYLKIHIHKEKNKQIKILL
jgi:hypothetical protein